MNFNCEKCKSLLSKIKPVDWIIIIGVLVALIVGGLTVTHFRGTASNQIEAQTTIGFQVFLRSITLTGNVTPIAPGDTTFITIRNVPYTNLKVLDAVIDTKKAVLPNPKGGKDSFVLVEDSSQAFLYDLVVTLVDENAKITKDGAVVGGNKIKIGLPVTLEGPSYKLNGVVSDVRILQPQTTQEQQNQSNQPKPDVNKHEQNVG